MNWTPLIEASTSDVHLMARDLTLSNEIREYARVVSAFLAGDVEKLREAVTAATVADVKLLGGLRLQTRLRNVNTPELMRIEELTLIGVLEGEKLFALGMAWEVLDNEAMARKAFARAAAVYRAHDCPFKGLRAHYNSVVAESRLTPHKNFVADYQAIVQASLDLKNLAFAGIARAMLSREYQVVGLREQALDLVEQSLTDLREERGTLHYFHSLLHKAHLLIELGRAPEAAPLLMESELANFPAIRAARLLLKTHLDETLAWDPALEDDLLPTWRNRLPRLLAGRMAVESGKAPATELERALLRLAYNGPIAKWDLIAKLYPAESDSLILENRFKNLVARVRKKYPQALLCHEGRYSVAKLPQEVTV